MGYLLTMCVNEHEDATSEDNRVSGIITECSLTQEEIDAISE